VKIYGIYKNSIFFKKLDLENDKIEYEILPAGKVIEKY